MSANDNMVFNRRDVNSENDDVWDDAALIKMYDRTKAMIYDKMQDSGGPSSTPSSAQLQTNNQAPRKWRVGEQCMAPFAEDGKYYPAKITKVLEKSKTCEVVYTEYDTSAIVKLADLLSGQKRAYPSPTTKTNSQLPASKKMCVQAAASTTINFYEDTVFNHLNLFSHIKNPGSQPNVSKTKPQVAEKRTIQTGASYSINFYEDTALLEGIKCFSDTRKSELQQKLTKTKPKNQSAVSPQTEHSNSANFYEDTVLEDIKLFSDVRKPAPQPKTSKAEHQIMVYQQKTGYYAGHSPVNLRRLAQNSTFQAKIYLHKNKPKLPKLHGFTPIPNGCLADFGASTGNCLKQKACAVSLYSEVIHERLGLDVSHACYTLDLSEDEVEYADENTSNTDNGRGVVEASSSSGQQQIFPVPELCPPPPPNLFGQIAQAGNDKEALTNMLMSWYMSGYHTGYFQGMQQGKKKQGGGTAQ